MPRVRKPGVNGITDSLRIGGGPVIIFGAGIAGEVLFYACAEAGIKVECFCDNNVNKTRALFCGVKVIHTPGLPAIHKDAVFLISAADIKDVVSQLGHLGYSKWRAGAELLRNFSLGGRQFSAPYDFVEYAVGTTLLCQDSYLLPDKIFLRSVDVIVTERCSRKCRDCSNLMQYYENPKNCATEDVFRELDALCAVVDEINEFRVIGGEPLMNPDFHLTVKRLAEEPKVKKVVIYTNGTIVPGAAQLESLKSPKVLFIITDYGPAAGQLEELRSVLSQAKVAFYIAKAGGWCDCAKIIRHGRTAEQRRQTFKSCCARNTFTLTDGRLFRCPFSANVHRLEAAPDYSCDYVALTHAAGAVENPAAIRKELKKFLAEKEFLEICDYCNGRSYGAPEITPAIQAPAPLPYKKHQPT